MNQPIALVTGGSRGLGASFVKKLTDDGYFVYFTYSENKTAAEELENSQNQKVKRTQAIKVNFNDHKSIKQLYTIIENSYSRLDLLVNNAGITKDMLMAKMDLCDWDDVIDTNLRSVFLITKPALNFMMPQKKGCIINITSVSGLRGAIGQCNYSASKGGIIGLTKSMAREFSQFNIRVNGIAPGFIETDMTKNISNIDRKKIYQSCLLKRFGKPHEVAEVVAFLASEKASYIQGQIIIVDGGVML